ncbi:MAG: hypothetical protein Q4G22_05115 [Paracoccus sp. (in: a-proteobacteria)]|uniref:hypothetical protein n=1 Tax=Paracoccus sp. TaxID=267 RepID=UPI0026E094AE|nr:hypothetical protein [Paracoccus sp. (in: a-proteobacteria)]MDO5631201.1 hypothetical protein [Paracoccus sp. (in: a-proteobacteria)]
MPFAPDERQVLLGAKFVGPMVVQRLEEAGFHDLASLAAADAGAICRGTAAALGASCWANSPQARRAVENAIAAARAAG